jgi:hypothetical protein
LTGGARFGLVEDDGTPSPDRVCPFCAATVTIGHYKERGKPPDPLLTVIHTAVPGGKVGADGLTGCRVYDAAAGPEEFLEQALPRLLAAEALACARRGGLVPSS